MKPAQDPIPLALPGPAARRLGRFLLGLLGILGVIEGTMRLREPIFQAASHRALTKAAILARRPEVGVIFLGTSRTQDGVNPDLVGRAIEERSPGLGRVPGFNAAFTGSSLESLLALVPRFGFRPDLRLVVIELSAPQIVNDPAPWEETLVAPKTLEERLGRTMRHVALVRHRKALLGDGLGRLPALLVFGDALGGWETKGSQQLASWLGHREPPATGFDPSPWTPGRFTGDAPRRSLDPSADQVADRLAEVARRFRSHGVGVRFAVPPLSEHAADAPERRDLQPLFAEVARRSGCEVWDFTAARPPEAFFKDAGHLNREGRAHYSRALGQRVADALENR